MEQMIPEITINPGQSYREELLRIAHGQTFPFFVLKITPDTKKEDHTLKMKVSQEIYDETVKRMGTDEIVCYLDTRGYKISNWSADMLFSVNTLNELGALQSGSNWTKSARKYITLDYKNETSQSSIPLEEVEKRLKIVEDLLICAGLKENLDKSHDLFTIAKDVKSSNSKDPTSIIYRLAMMVYHSARLAGRPAVEELEDPGAIYLRIIDNEDFKKRYNSLYESLIKFPYQVRSSVLKTFISFVIGSYLYYKGAYNLRE